MYALVVGRVCFRYEMFCLARVYPYSFSTRNQMSQKLSKNVFVAVSQIMVTGGVLFALYRFLVIKVGVQQVGVWSLVFAVASISGVAQLGLGGSVVKYVAKYLAKSDANEAGRSIQTAAISTMMLMSAGVTLLYPLLYWVISVVVETQQVDLARTLLLPTLIVVMLNALSGVFQSGLDGCQRIDVRSYIVMVGSLVYLVCVFWLVPTYGLIGLVYAQIAQGLLLLITAWLVLRVVLPNLPLIPVYWSKEKFREMAGYGVNFQFISLTQVFSDPATKLLLGYFGGLSLVGYYEMANRMVMQLRALFVAGNQVLVPVVSVVSEDGGKGFVDLYLRSFGITIYISSPFFFLIVAASPYISRLWIGSYEQIFVLSVAMISLSHWLNTLSAPAYFSYLGIGYLRSIVIGHILVALSNIILGYMLGRLVGGIGPIVGSALAISLGALFVVDSCHKRYEIRLTETVLRNYLPVLMSCILATIISLSLYKVNISGGNMIHGLVAVVLVFAVLVVPAMWMHPLRREILKVILVK